MNDKLNELKALLDEHSQCEWAESLDTYFSGGDIRWLIEKVEELRDELTKYVVLYANEKGVLDK
jgi:glycerol kinase